MTITFDQILHESGGVVVFSKPNCTDCESTKNFLKNNDVEFLELNIAEDDSAREYLMSAGVMRMPFVVTREDKWSGYNKARLAALVG